MDFSIATTNATNTTTSSANNAISPFIIGLLLQFVAVLDSLGNLMVIVAVLLCKNWIITDVLLLSLSVADFFDAAAALQMVVLIKYFRITSWTPPSCDVFVVMVYTFRMASATTVTLIAVERALILVCPLKHHTTVTKTKIKKAVVAVWVLAILCAILPLIGIGHSGFVGQECYFQLYELGKSFTIFFEVIGLLMLALVLSCYVAIKMAGGKFIKRQLGFTTSTKHRANQSQKLVSTVQKEGSIWATRKITRGSCKAATVRRDSRGVQSVRKVSTMMGVVVFLYYVSWLPFLLSNLASLITGHSPKQSVQLFTGMISFMHALVNPWLYGLMSPRYKKAYIYVFRWLLLLCGGKVQVRQNSTRGRSRFNSAADMTLSTELALSRSSIPNLNAVATSSLNSPIQRLMPLNRNIETIQGRRENNLQENEDDKSGICCGPQGVNESESLVADSVQPHQSSYGLQKNTTKDDLTSSPTQSLESSQNGDCCSISNELTSSKTSEKEESTTFIKTFARETENDFSIYNGQPISLNQGTFTKQHVSGQLKSNDHIATDQSKELGKLHASFNGFSDENTQEEKDLKEVELSTLIEKFATNITTEILKNLI